MLLDEYLAEIQQEGKRASMHRVSRKTKIKRVTSQLASIAARKKNDPMYKQMIRYRELYFKYRERIHKKYSPRVRSRARR